LWLRFELEERDRLLAVLQFLRPITAAAAKDRADTKTRRFRSRRLPNWAFHISNMGLYDSKVGTKTLFAGQSRDVLGRLLMGPAPASPRPPGVHRLSVEEFNVSIAH
jgi:hypothetical protein